MPYTPLALANYFVHKHGKNASLDHMKLQKLVYNAYGWWLSHKHEPLTTEDPQVWKYGPVFYSLYHSLKPYGNSQIREPKARTPFEEPPIVEDEDAKRFLDWIWERYGHLSAFALSDLTHKEGTPWHRTAKEHNFRVPPGTAIPKDYVRQEFRNLAADEGVVG